MMSDPPSSPLVANLSSINQNITPPITTRPPIKPPVPPKTAEKIINSVEFGFWRRNLKSLLYSQPGVSTFSFSSTDITTAVSIVTLKYLNINLQMAGLDKASRNFCWMDMSAQDKSSISETVIFQLCQALVKLVQNNTFRLPDPSENEIKETFSKISRLVTPGNRCLVIINSQGSLKPVSDHSLFLEPNRSAKNDMLAYLEDRNLDTFSEITISDMLSTLTVPSCFIFECDYAGRLYDSFKNTCLNNNSNHVIDSVAFFACNSSETLPHRLGFPPDLFTCCLLYPALVAILFASRQFSSFNSNSSGLHLLHLSFFSDENGIKPFLISISYEIEQILTVLVKSIAANVLPPEILYNCFYRDPKLGQLYINFCLAKRIASELGFTPLSYPKIEDFSNHPLWDFFDLYIDKVLYRLSKANLETNEKNDLEFSASSPQETFARSFGMTNYSGNGRRSSYSSSTEGYYSPRVSSNTILNNGNQLFDKQKEKSDKFCFLNDNLVSIENSLGNSYFGNIPLEFAFAPLILKEPELTERMIFALALFIDKDSKDYQSLQITLAEGIVPILLEVVNCAYKQHPKILLPSAYIIAKLLAYSLKGTRNLANFTCSGFSLARILFMAKSQPIAYNTSVPPYYPSEIEKTFYQVFALIILTTGIELDPEGEIQSVSTDFLKYILSLIPSQSSPTIVKFWALLFISQYLAFSSRRDLGIDILSALLSAINSPNSEIRAAFGSAFGSYTSFMANNLDTERFIQVNQKLDQEVSQLVRLQHLFSLQEFYLSCFSQNQNNPRFIEADHSAMKSLSLLTQDAHPEISTFSSLLAQQVHSKNVTELSISPSLIPSSFDAFLSASFDKLKEFVAPPFNQPIPRPKQQNSPKKEQQNRNPQQNINSDISTNTQQNSPNNHINPLQGISLSQIPDANPSPNLSKLQNLTLSDIPSPTKKPTGHSMSISLSDIPSMSPKPSSSHRHHSRRSISQDPTQDFQPSRFPDSYIKNTGTNSKQNDIGKTSIPNPEIPKNSQSPTTPNNSQRGSAQNTEISRPELPELPRASKNCMFKEIDHFDTPSPISTNLIFIGSERIVFGDTNGNISIRNYFTHLNEFTLSPDKYFSMRASSHLLQTVIPLSDDCLLLTNLSGDVAVVANFLTNSPTLADSFSLRDLVSLDSIQSIETEWSANLHSFLQQSTYSAQPSPTSSQRGFSGSPSSGGFTSSPSQRNHKILSRVMPYVKSLEIPCPTVKIDYDKHTRRVMAAFKKKMAIWDITTCKLSPSKEMVSSDITGVQVLSSGYVALASKDLRIFDIRAASQPQIIIDQEFGSFREIPYNVHKLIGSDGDGKIWTVDMREPHNKEAVGVAEGIRSIDTCSWGPFSLLTGDSLNFVDYISRINYGVIESMYPKKIKHGELQIASLHPKDSIFGFVAKNTSLNVVRVDYD